MSAVPSRASRDESFASVATALAANTTIAVAKGIAAVLTGSPALLAETLHTTADAGNEVLLWVALRRSRRAPDAFATIVIGLMLGYVAVRLTSRNRQLLANRCSIHVADRDRAASDLVCLRYGR